jgi:hypothetical protein
MRARPRPGSSRRQAPLSVLQHGLDLLADDTGKPVEEVVHCGTVFQALEKRSHLHPCVLEHLTNNPVPPAGQGKDRILDIAAPLPLQWPSEYELTVM